MPPLLDFYLNDTLKSSPLIYWRMREGSGTTVFDSSPNVKNGTYSGTGINWTSSGQAGSNNPRSSGRDAPLFNSTVPVNDFTSNPNVVINAANNAYFDGAAGQATATLNSPAINTSAASVVTVSGWVRWDGVLAGSNGTYEAIFNFGGAAGLLLGFLKNGASDYRFGLSVRNSGDLWGLSNATTLALLTKDVYHYIVFVIVNNAVQTSKLYIDGTQVTMTQQIGTSTTTDSVTSAFALAYDGTASFFGGSISEVAVYNGEPYTASAVRNRYHIGAYGGGYQEIATLPGLETQIELSDPLNNIYGFVLNDKNPTLPGNRSRTLNQYYITDIGGLDDADVRFAEESNFYRDGVNPLLSRYGGRTITFDGYIEASNFQSLRQMQSNLKRAIANNSVPSGISESPMILRNVWNNGFDFSINVRKGSSLQIKESQTNPYARRNFLITMRASFPFFESLGSRTEVLQMGATVPIPHKGNTFGYPVITFWGPFTDARLILNNTAIITGSVAASNFVQLDCKNRTCTDWTKFNTTGDFPYINYGVLSDTWQNYAQFVSVAGGTIGQTRVEITWKHTLI